MTYPHDPFAQKYIDDRNAMDMRQILLERAEKKVREARTALYIIAGLSALGGFLVYMIDKSNGIEIIITNLIVALVFLILGFYLEKRPRVVILTSIIIFCSIWLINILINPANIFSGILIKIFIIGALAKGFRSAREVEGLRIELGKIDTKDENAPLDMIK